MNEIGYSVYPCPNGATRGGIFRHGSRPHAPIFPVYYYCPVHGDRLSTALDTWALEPRPYAHPRRTA